MSATPLLTAQQRKRGWSCTTAPAVGRHRRESCSAGPGQTAQAVLRRERPRLQYSGSYLPLHLHQKQCFTLKHKRTYSRGFSWNLCVTKYRTRLANPPQNLVLYQHPGNVEASALQGWRGGEHFQRQQRHTQICNEELVFQVNEIQKGWLVSPCQNTCLSKPGPAGAAVVL